MPNEKIINLGSRQFMIQSEMTLTPEIEGQVMKHMMQRLSPATCPNVVQGTTHNVTLTVSGGQPNYTYRLFLDGTQINTAGPTSATSQTFSVTFNQVIGAHTLMGQVTDSCGTPQTASDTCTSFNIVAPTPVLTSISISGCTGTLNVGNTCSLTAVCTDQNNAVMTCPALTWTSSNTNIATVSSSGVVSAVAAGSCTITASSGSVVSNQATINVAVQCPAITGCSVAASATTITQGQQLVLTGGVTGGTTPYAMSFYRDAGVFLGTALSPPYNLVITAAETQNWAPGNHTIFIVVTDKCIPAQQCQSTGINITVQAACAALGVSMQLQ